MQSFQHPSQLHTQKPAQQGLLNRIAALEEKVEKLKRELAVSKNTNSLLGQKIDNLHQYQRQACLRIDGIKPCKEETEDQIRAIAKSVLYHDLGLTRNETQFEIWKTDVLKMHFVFVFRRPLHDVSKTS